MPERRPSGPGPPHVDALERAEREVAAHIAVAGALAAWDRTEDGSARLLAELAESLDFQAAVLWAPRGDRLEPRAFWHAQTGDLGELETMTLTSRLPRGVDLPGQAWQRLEPQLRTHTGGLASPRWRAAMAAGFRGAIAFPAVWADKVAASAAEVRQGLAQGEHLGE